MIFGRTKLELKVGIFVFFGLLILVVFILSIGGFKSWTQGYRVKINFDFINGVKIGAPVRFAGIDVGDVKKINFIFLPEGPKVEVTAWVKKDIKIPQDSTVWVNTLGLLGEKYIEIMPGKDWKNIVAQGRPINGRNPVAMHEVAELVKNMANDFEAIMAKIKNGQGTVGKLLTDDSIYNGMESLVLDLKKHPWKLFWKGKE